MQQCQDTMPSRLLKRHVVVTERRFTSDARRLGDHLSGVGATAAANAGPQREDHPHITRSQQCFVWYAGGNAIGAGLRSRLKVLKGGRLTGNRPRGRRCTSTIAYV
jgi:hypothetical protein